jgi:hypothetical protein
MERRKFIKIGTVAVAGIVMHSKAIGLGMLQNDKPLNILFVNAHGFDLNQNIESEMPGRVKLLQNSICNTQSYATKHKGVPILSGLLKASGYEQFHVGNLNRTDLHEESATVIRQGGGYGELSDQDVTDGARSFLRNYQEKKPFFLSVNYQSMYEENTASPYNKMQLFEKVDIEIDLLLFELERSLWKNDTLIIVASDSGESDQTKEKETLVFATLEQSTIIANNTFGMKDLVSEDDFTQTVRHLSGINSNKITV